MVKLLIESGVTRNAIKAGLMTSLSPVRLFDATGVNPALGGHFSKSRSKAKRVSDLNRSLTSKINLYCVYVTKCDLFFLKSKVDSH